MPAIAKCHFSLAEARRRGDPFNVIAWRYSVQGRMERFIRGGLSGRMERISFAIIRPYFINGTMAQISTQQIHDYAQRLSLHP